MCMFKMIYILVIAILLTSSNCGNKNIVVCDHPVFTLEEYDFESNDTMLPKLNESMDFLLNDLIVNSSVGVSKRKIKKLGKAFNDVIYKSYTHDQLKLYNKKTLSYMDQCIMAYIVLPCDNKLNNIVIFNQDYDSLNINHTYILLHELNHMVYCNSDFAKIDKVLNKLVYNNINYKINKFIHGFELLQIASKRDISNAFSNAFNSNRKYYFSNVELYSRINNMKYYAYKNKLVKFDDLNNLTKHDIINIIEFMQTTTYISADGILDSLDFVYLLPFMSDNLDIINKI